MIDGREASALAGLAAGAMERIYELASLPPELRDPGTKPWDSASQSAMATSLPLSADGDSTTWRQQRENHLRIFGIFLVAQIAFTAG